MLPAQSVQTPPEPAPPPIVVPPAVPSTVNKRRPTLEYRPGEDFAGRYKIAKLIGKGGMGAVYLAEQTTLARNVAIKLLHGTADPMTTARFQREARVIAQLQHPHIVNLIDFGDADGQLFLVMEFIDGEPLSKLVKREGAMAQQRALDLAIQIAEALAVAHGVGVIHRDVKPDNLMVLKTSTGKEFMKVLDFGVAKINREANASNTIQTQAGMIVGSLRYIAPEQLESKDVTARTDMYAFGCVLYEMLTGRRVFEYQAPADCALAHLAEKPQPPAVGGKPLTGPLVDFVMRCLEKDPLRRPGDAREGLEMLLQCRSALSRPVSAPVQPRTEGTPRVTPKHPSGLQRIGGTGGGRERGQGDPDANMTLQGDGTRRPSHSGFDAVRTPAVAEAMASPTSPNNPNPAGTPAAARGRAETAPRRGNNEILLDGPVVPATAAPASQALPEQAGATSRRVRPARTRERAALPVWVWFVGALVVVAFGLALGFFLSRRTTATPTAPPPAAETAPTAPGSAPGTPQPP